MPDGLPRSTPQNRAALRHSSNEEATGVPFCGSIDRLDSVVREGFELLSLAATDEERTVVKQQYGLSDSGPTPLSSLPGFLYHTAATYEALHIGLLGVGRLVMKLYCGKHKKISEGERSIQPLRQTAEGHNGGCRKIFHFNTFAADATFSP